MAEPMNRIAAAVGPGDQMNFKMQMVGLLLITSTIATGRTHAQANEVVNLLRDFETRAAGAVPLTPEEAEPVIERFAQANKESMTEALPVILEATRDPHVAVRRVAAMALFSMTRPDVQALLTPQSATFARLLNDPDIPIRRLTSLVIANLHLNETSSLVPTLEAYLAREDAVETIGAGVAGLLMEAAPDNVESTNAVVHFMQRKDQTLTCRTDLLQSVRVARSHNREIGKAVASYADELDEQTSVDAIETLQGMGRVVVTDNQQLISRIAGDSRRASTVREAAAKSLSTVP